MCAWNEDFGKEKFVRWTAESRDEGGRVELLLEAIDAWARKGLEGLRLRGWPPLIALQGAPGTGKTWLLKCIREEYPEKAFYFSLLPFPEDLNSILMDLQKHLNQYQDQGSDLLLLLDEVPASFHPEFETLEEKIIRPVLAKEGIVIAARQYPHYWAIGYPDYTVLSLGLLTREGTIEHCQLLGRGDLAEKAWEIGRGHPVFNRMLVDENGDMLRACERLLMEWPLPPRLQPKREEMLECLQAVAEVEEWRRSSVRKALASSHRRERPRVHEIEDWFLEAMWLENREGLLIWLKAVRQCGLCLRDMRGGERNG